MDDTRSTMNGLTIHQKLALRSDEREQERIWHGASRIIAVI